jgi:hypothetical protein
MKKKKMKEVEQEEEKGEEEKEEEEELNNTDFLYIIPKTRGRRNTSKHILQGPHYPDTKAR